KTTHESHTAESQVHRLVAAVVSDPQPSNDRDETQCRSKLLAARSAIARKPRQWPPNCVADVMELKESVAAAPLEPGGSRPWDGHDALRHATRDAPRPGLAHRHIWSAASSPMRPVPDAHRERPHPTFHRQGV